MSRVRGFMCLGQDTLDGSFRRIGFWSLTILTRSMSVFLVG
jgi:hypothetical protein